jgi:hypothetical protein
VVSKSQIAQSDNNGFIFKSGQIFKEFPQFADSAHSHDRLLDDRLIELKAITVSDTLSKFPWILGCSL